MALRVQQTQNIIIQSQCSVYNPPWNKKWVNLQSTERSLSYVPSCITTLNDLQINSRLSLTDTAYYYLLIDNKIVADVKTTRVYVVMRVHTYYTYTNVQNEWMPLQQ